MQTATSTVTSDDLDTRRISKQSLWSDNIWRLDNVTPGTHAGNYTLDWGFMLPDGSRFGDARWTAWRDDAKSFLISLREDPAEGRPRSGDNTLQSLFKSLRVLIRWMAGEGYLGFAMLDRDGAERFMMAMQERRQSSGEHLAPSTLSRYADMVRQLFLQGEKLPGGGPPEDPFPGLTAGALIGASTRTAKVKSLPHTPDHIAIPLIAAALRLIGGPADDVIALRSQAQQVYDTAIAVGRSQTRAGFAVMAILPEFQFRTLPNEDGPWHDPVSTTKQVRELVDRVTDACFIVIAYLIGARVSEIMSLEEGCIEHHPSADSSEQFAYVRGTIWKSASNPGGKPHRWVAPAPVVRAITVIEQLSEPLRARKGVKTLFLVLDSTGLIGIKPGIGVPGVSTWTRRLNLLFKPFIGLETEGDDAWHLSTHQGRKTFARFIGKRDRSGLDALYAHLGHVNRAMTDRAYVGTDFQLGELIDAQIMEETAEALEELLTASSLAGKGARGIVARSPFRGRTRDGEVKAYVEYILRETDMRLGVCDWGYCIYRRESAACIGDDHGPNPALRTQSVCVSCVNFAITEKHRPVWEDRRRRNLDLMTLPLDRESADLARQRVSECDRLLAQLDEAKDQHHAT